MCSQPLILRRNPNTGKRVLLCQNAACTAPKKRFSNLPSRGDFFPHPDRFKCPLCQYEVLHVLQQLQQQAPASPGYFFCPHCYCDPPTQFDSATSPDGGGHEEGAALVDLEAVGFTASMPCFKCRKTDCALSPAEASLTLTPCPECRRDFLVLRKGKDGKSKFIACRDQTCRGGGGANCLGA